MDKKLDRLERSLTNIPRLNDASLLEETSLAEKGENPSEVTDSVQNRDSYLKADELAILNDNNDFRD